MGTTYESTILGIPIFCLVLMINHIRGDYSQRSVSHGIQMGRESEIGFEEVGLSDH